jgi:acyl transferase domain-containing protein/NAD(P)-dependent dehydrogenase (short-subunit alcohol dehydrogenase family)
MTDDKVLDYLKRVTADLHLTRQRLREVESQDQEPIAIVGMGCRFPGGVRTPEDFWRLVAEGTDAVSGFPDDRGWHVDSLYDPDPDRPGTSYVREGGFVHDVGAFDAGFFGISPREAVSMDPQQRVLLEVSWEALERAGIDPVSVRGDRVGVFAGTNGQDYGAVLARSPDADEGYLGTGNTAAVVSGRVAYTLGLEGPAVTVDTACSSSLVAIHWAIQALRQGECSLALAGGATVMSTPAVFVAFSRQRGLAADGRCKAFAEAANGTAWGEGAGMVVLQRLSDAQRDGHPVLALVRGSAVNQDGASNGLTAPNGPAQQRVIRQALAAARLSVADVDAVEAHGTGTTLGDPIEAQALLATYGQDRDADRPLWLGSVKSNIGHTQAAAGMAGVIKMVMAMRHGVLPPTLHVDRPSSHVDWSAGHVRLLTEPTEWPATGRPRRAGVSSFGVSGTNAHVVLEQPPTSETVAPQAKSIVVPWVLAGVDATALREQAGRLRAHLAAAPDLTPVDVGFSLATTRSVFDHRAVVVGADRDTMLDGLTALADGRGTDAVTSGVAGTDVDDVAFLFPADATAWAPRAAELLDRYPAFAERMAECERALTRFVDWSPTAVLRGAIVVPEREGPVSFALMVSLAALWRAHGVVPDAVTGTGVGEVVAACVAGTLTLDEAAGIVTSANGTLPEDVQWSAPPPQGHHVVEVGLPSDVGAVAGSLAVLAGLHVRGVRVDWRPSFAGTDARTVPLPTYAFRRRRYWARLPESAPPADPTRDRFWDLVARADIGELATALDLPTTAPLDAVLPALSAYRARSHERSTVDSWRYAISWTPLPEHDTRLSGTWLAVLPEAHTDLPLVSDTVRALETAGATVVPVVPDTDDRTQLRRWLATAVAGQPIAGVLSLLALDDRPHPLFPAVPRGHAATVALVQALGDERVDGPVWLATRAAVSTGRSDPLTSPEQALVWGFGRVVGLEHPDRWGGLVDLPATLDQRAATRLTRVLAAVDGEDQVAVRGSGVLGRRLVRRPLGGRTAPRKWRPSGTVLVTGGTGALGAHVARWLARNGVRRLLLTSRRGSEAPGAAELAGELAAHGVEVRVTACDVADRAAVAALLAGIPDEHPLTAVVHTAAALADGLVDSLTPGQLDSALRAKVMGARNLDELTRDLDLSAFVLFSSTAGTVGGVGHGNYAPGNAYLDALAHQRRAAGHAATSAVWGPWAGEGMAAGAVSQRLRRHGIRELAPDLAIAALHQALDHDETVPVFMDVDWDRFAAGLTSAGRPRPLFADLPEARRADTGVGVDEPGLRAALAGLSDTERRSVLLDLVRGQVAAVLGYPGPEAVDAERVFRDLGFDSLTSVELCNGLSAATGLALPATLVFDHPTPTVLAAHLLTELGDAGPTPAPPARAVGVADDDPIAIVGMGCRFPGGVRDPRALWELLAGGVDTVSGLPTDRGWDLDALYDPDPEHEGTSYVREGSFLDGATDFDPAFFGISPREALAMDPQQRVLLEISWEALERAGIDPVSVRGDRVGVFAGTNGQDYPTVLALSGEDVGGYLGTGNAASVLSGRIAYTLGLEGPAVTVDTACSSSLVALHWAARSLRGGECSLALAGGVTIMSTPGLFVEFSRQRGLAADGRCKAFAESADGTGWSEGAGMLLLERLSDARANGHPVLAVVRGSAVNQDGASNGLTAPNGPSQQRVIRAALADAGLRPSDVDAVEAHGTGTALGDPIEAQALLATYGQDRDVDRPLWLGSVKSNIGHTQAAAGMAGLMKMVLALRHGSLPATLHVDRPSSHVDWSAGDVRLLTEPVAWPDTDRPRRAGVSSFGLSGTNAHVIIEQAPVVEQSEPVEDEQAGPLLWPLSARDEQGLRDTAARLLAVAGEHSPRDVGFSLATTRPAFACRTVIVAERTADFTRGLTALAGGTETPGLTRGTVGRGGTAFLFTGQGAQRAGMGSELYARFPVCAGAFDEVCAHLDAELDRPLRDVVFGGGADLDRTGYTQPALFAVEVALYRLVESWGLRAGYLMGHSVGELVAAAVAGVFSLADACTLVAARGRLMQALPPGGGMVALQADEDEIIPLLVDGVGIAAVNGPRATVVSGDLDAVLAIAAQVRGWGGRTSRLRVSHAFHSPHLDGMLADFRAVAEDVTYRPPAVPIVSNATGRLATADGLCSPEYWVRQAREAVRFGDGLRSLAAEGVTRYLELGPDAVLSAFAMTTLADGAVVVPALRRAQPEVATLLGAVAALHADGASPDWPQVFAGTGARRVDLPTYPFQRTRFWPRPSVRSAGDVGSAGLTPAGHPLLGANVALPDGDRVVLTGRLATATHPWLADHTVSGSTVLPGTAFVELAVAAGDEVGCYRLDELVLQSPLVLPPGGAVDVRVVVESADPSGSRGVSVHSRAAGAPRDEPWTRNALGVLGTQDDTPDDTEPQPQPQEQWPPDGATGIDLTGLYDDQPADGVGYGPAFQGLRAAWHRDEEVFVEIALPEPVAGIAGEYGLHPALLDAALHVLGLGTMFRQEGRNFLPFSWTGVTLHATGASAARVRIARVGPDAVSLDLADTTGRPIASVASLVLRPVVAGRLVAASPARPDSMFRLTWTPVPLPSAPPAFTRRWAVLGDDELGVGPALDTAGVHLESYTDLAALADGVDLGMALPPLVFVCCTGTAGALDVAAHAVARRALDLVSGWLADDRFTRGRLVFVTSGAVGAGIADPAAATVWGLVRSAQSEHPDRFLLVDVDSVDGTVLAGTVLAAQPQMVVRDGVPSVPRLARATPSPVDGRTGLDPDSCVLVTGGTGGLGALLARHLVRAHGVRHLLLAGRRGLDAPGADGLVADLTALGADVTVVACDLADRQQVARLLAGRSLSAVVHAAGVLADGVVTALSADRLRAVLAPKVDAAVHLAALTADTPDVAFVLFSSVSGVLGGPGQANYAAANAFLDALAGQARAAGRPMVSLAWGPWAADGGMADALADTDRRRIARGGIGALSAEQGLALFDAALAGLTEEGGDAALVPMALDVAALRADPDAVPPVLSGLVGGRVRRAVTASTGPDVGTLRERLAAESEAGREKVLLDLVCGQAATVLGFAAAESLRPDQGLIEAGFDSLTAVELRNRLGAATGLRLPPTLVFDFPTPADLAAYLHAELGSDVPAVAPDAPDAPVATAERAETLGALFRDACRSGRLDDGFLMLKHAAVLRQTFSSAADLDRTPNPVKLAAGPDRPSLVCLSSYVALGGVHQYARLASSFRDVRDVWALPMPGFVRGEQVPASREALVEVQAQVALRCAGDGPFVLLGSSSGGVLAHAVAGVLTERGRPPEAVVLLDTYLPHADSKIEQFRDELIGGMFDREEMFAPMDVARLTAMSTYFELLGGWEPGELTAPTLLVRSSTPPVPDGPDGPLRHEDWQTHWDSAHTTLDVPGNHFTMMEAHAATTADAVSAWLRRVGVTGGPHRTERSAQ